MPQIITDKMIPVYTEYACDECGNDTVEFIDKRNDRFVHKCKSCGSEHRLDMKYPAAVNVPEQLYISQMNAMAEASKSPILTMNQ